MTPSGGRKELNKTMRSLAVTLSQSILHTANLLAISFVSSASLSSSPHGCTIFTTSLSVCEKKKHS